MTWQGKARDARLPKDWRTRRRHILALCPRCYLCGNPATEVDHINPGDNHSAANLAGICNPCHRTKSAREGATARHQIRNTRAPEPHPGHNT